MNNTFINIILNISMLVMLATLLVNIPFFQKIILHEKNLQLHEQCLLGIIMGGGCIFSNYIGIQINAAVLNSRVIGALGASLLGGPVSGIIAASIGIIHRYYLEPNGITTIACCVATFSESLIGIVVWYYFTSKNKRYESMFLFIFTALCETMHMGIIFVLARPFSEARVIVETIAVPMVLFNAVGMVVFFSVFRNVYKQQDKQLSHKMLLAFEIAEKSLPYLEKALKGTENFQKVIDIIMSKYNCEGVAIANKTGYLGKSTVFEKKIWAENVPSIVSLTMDNKIARIWDRNSDDYFLEIEETDIFHDLLQKNVAITAPLIVSDDILGCLIMLVRRREYNPQVELSFINGIASLFSTQLALAQFKRQKNLLRKAEFQALQSQINPHFLFNALNTISCFCREKPERARELLIDLTTYFRNSLQDVTSMVTVEKELQHIKAYLELEKARFEEKLQINLDVDKLCNNDKIPNLILQPIVENAVKHGAIVMDQGMIIIHIYHSTTQKLCLEVWDNGLGFPEDVLDSLKTRKKNYIGIGLWNVNERLMSIYGDDTQLEIEHINGKTRVKMELPL
ncbi:MAG: LytS/YhcK type 5TM receptor domain-containing protein [Lachnotalea sp.]